MAAMELPELRLLVRDVVVKALPVPQSKVKDQIKTSLVCSKKSPLGSHWFVSFYGFLGVRLSGLQ